MIAYSVVFGRTDLMELQSQCLRKFCASVEELVIVNNGPNFDAIYSESVRLGLRCVPHTRRYWNPSEHHAAALNAVWSWQVQQDGGESLFMDMDIFPLRKTNPLELLDGCTMAGVVQIKGDILYPWPGLLAIRRNIPAPSILRFDCSPGLDSGGGIAEYLRSTGATCNWIPEVQCKDDSIFTNIIANDWGHFRDVSNWRRQPQAEVNRRIELLKDYLRGILK